MTAVVAGPKPACTEATAVGEPSNQLRRGGERRVWWLLEGSRAEGSKVGGASVREQGVVLMSSSRHPVLRR